MKLTNKLVKDFWAYMKKKYDFRVISKASASEMDAIGWILDKMGIQDHKKFMKNYATTLGRNVYVPFKIGVCKDDKERIMQIETCVHEAQHVKQYRRNPGKFIWNYVTSAAARTNYEVDAYRTNMEIYYFFTGKVLSPTLLAYALSAYGVGKADLQVARKHFVTMAKVVKYGGVMSSISKVAIKWFKGKTPARKSRR